MLSIKEKKLAKVLKQGIKQARKGACQCNDDTSLAYYLTGWLLSCCKINVKSDKVRINKLLKKARQ